MTTDNEKAVIGAILQNPEALRFAVEHITGDDFRDHRLAAVFNVMNGLRGAGEPVDELTVTAAVNERGYRIDGLELFDMRAFTPTHENIAYYARRVAEAAGMRRLEAFGTRVAQMAQARMPHGEVMETVRAEWAALNDAAARGADMYVPTLGELLDGPTEYDWVIPDLMERDDRLVITGGEGAGKSYFVQQLAILSAAGIHPTTFKAIDPVRVLVIDAENSDKQWRRRVGPFTHKAAREGQADPRLSMRIKTLPRMNILDEKDLARVHRWLDEYPSDLVVIGPFYKLTPKAINSDDDAAPVIAALDGIRARGCALVMEAHAGKGLGADGERNLAPRGASALMGWPEFGFGLRLERVPEGVPTYAELVRWRGDRDERAWPNRLKRGGRWPWSDADAELTAWEYEQATQPKYA